MRLGAGDSVTLTFSIERFYSSKEALLDMLDD